MAAPAQVDVWVGLDVGKGEHFADVLDNDGERLFARAVANDQADLEALLDRAARHGTPGLVIDQPGSIAQLALAVAARRGVPVAYVPGLAMRRAANLYPAMRNRPPRCLRAGRHRPHPAQAGPLAGRLLHGCRQPAGAQWLRRRPGRGVRPG